MQYFTWNNYQRGLGDYLEVVIFAEQGHLLPEYDAFLRQLNSDVAICIWPHVSNALAIFIPVEAICRWYAKQLYCCYSMVPKRLPIMPVDVFAMDCDFLLFFGFTDVCRGVGRNVWVTALLISCALRLGGRNVTMCILLSGYQRPINIWR